MEEGEEAGGGEVEESELESGGTCAPQFIRNLPWDSVKESE